MGRPTNPVLMSTILNAIAHLSEEKGSTVRDILKFVRRNPDGCLRNLTMQVHRALKHAVDAGLLRHRGGRYKVLISVNPISAQQSLPEDSKSDDDIVDKVPNGSSERSKRRKESDKQQGNNKRPSHKRAASKSGQRKNKRQRNIAEAVKETKVVLRRQKRKSNGKVEVYDDWLPPVRHKRVAKRKVTDIEQEEDLSPSSNHSEDHICDSASDVSDACSVYEISSGSKNKFYAHEERRSSPLGRKRSQIRQELKGQMSRARSRKRSTSRNRSLQGQSCNQNQQEQQQQNQQQLEIQEVPNDNLDDVRIECEQVHGNVEHNDEPVNPDIDRTCEANNSGSGSSLED